MKWQTEGSDTVQKA